MYRILVVDDETIVRLAIREIISNADSEFQVVAEGENGKQALQRYQEHGKIDIVLTDITMPISNGLELTKVLMGYESPPIIVVISSYNDYALVREAFTLGAKDYILKSHLNRENLFHLLNKLVEKERVIRQKQDRSRKYEKEILLKGLLEGRYPQQLAHRCQELKVRLNTSDVTVCSILIDDFLLVKEKHCSSGNLKSLLADTLSPLLTGNRQGEMLPLSEGSYVLFLSFNIASSQAYIDSLDSLMRQFQYNLNNYANIKATIGISERGNLHIASKMFDKSQQNASLRFILGKNRIIYPWTGNQFIQEKRTAIDLKMENLLEALEMTAESSLQEELAIIFERIRQVPTVSISKIYFTYMEMIFHINKFIDDAGYSVEEVFGKDLDFYEKIQIFETTTEINLWIENMLKWILSFFKEKRNVGTKSQIEKAREFIRRNYEKDLPLKVVSDHVSLSENYFSAQFLKYTGKNFSEYIFEVRMEKAQKYLRTTDLKIYEISMKIGYASVEHFSRMFKKYIGMSPVKYRKKYNVHKIPQ